MGRGSTREVVINIKSPRALHNDPGITVSGSVKFKSLHQDKASAMLINLPLLPSVFPGGTGMSQIAALSALSSSRCNLICNLM